MKICQTLLIFIVLIITVSFANAIEQEIVTNTKETVELNSFLICLQQKGCGGPEEEIKKGGLQLALKEIGPDDEECYKQCNVDITCYFKEKDACWGQIGYQDNDLQLIQCSNQATETCQVTKQQPTEILIEDKKAVTETNTMMICLQQKGCGGPEEEIKKGGLQLALQEIGPDDEECYKQCNVDITCYFKEKDACWGQIGYQDNDLQLIQCSNQATETCAKNYSVIERIINWLRNLFN